MTVSVTADDRSWLLQVSDAAADRAPAAAVDRDPARGGLGLGLVAEMSVNHGWRVDADGGKTVWALVAFRHPGAAEQGAAAASWHWLDQTDPQLPVLVRWRSGVC